MPLSDEEVLRAFERGDRGARIVFPELAEVGWSEDAYRENPIARAEVRFIARDGTVIDRVNIDHTPYDGAGWIVPQSWAIEAVHRFGNSMKQAVRDMLLKQRFDAIRREARKSPL